MIGANRPRTSCKKRPFCAASGQENYSCQGEREGNDVAISTERRTNAWTRSLSHSRLLTVEIKSSYKWRLARRDVERSEPLGIGYAA